MAYKEKFLDTIITDAGRQLLLDVGAGQGKLYYTRAILSSQTVRHLDPSDDTGKTVTGMDDEAIRQITKPDDELRSAELLVSPVLDNTITVSASFDNRDLGQDIKFNTIFWFAKMDDKSEIVLGITPTAKQDEILAAGSPDHRSSEAINCDLNMAISNAAQVDMTVNEAGLVRRGELNAWVTNIKDGIDKEIKAEVDKVQITTADGSVFKQDDSRNINLPVILKSEFDKAMSAVAKGFTINGVKPDDKGNFDLGSSTLIQGIQTTLTNILNRLDYIEKNYLEGRRFNVKDDDAAMAWEKEKITRIAMMVDDSATPPSTGTGTTQPTQPTQATQPTQPTQPTTAPSGGSTGTQTSGDSGTTTNK